MPLKGPSADGLVESLLRTVGDAAPPGAPGRAVAVELWADHMATLIYDRESMPRQFYVDLAEGLVASPHPHAPAVLAAMAVALDHPGAAPVRTAQAEAVARRGADDATDLGIGRPVGTRALVVDHVQGDGVSIVVDFDQPGGAHSISVYVDHNLLGIAKDLSVGPPWDEQASRAEMLAVPDMSVTEISLAEARARIEDAMTLTEHSPGAPVSDDYDRVAAVVARRAAVLPAGGTPPPRPTVDEDELEAIVEGFLASPEVEALPPPVRDQAGWIAELWIDHAVNETIGGPLRISEVLVELFCVVGFNDVQPDEATVAAAPAVLEAWIRYASRVTGLRDEWRDEALGVLERFGPHLGRPELLGGGIEAALGLAELDDERVAEAFADASTLPPVDPGAWQPLQEPSNRRLRWDGDVSDVRPELVTQVTALCPLAAHLANALLGPVFVEPVIDVVVSLGQVEPTVLDEHSPAEPWVAAAVWLLAEDSGAFTEGRDPADLAAALGSTPDSLAAGADALRRQSGTRPGALAIPW